MALTEKQLVKLKESVTQAVGHLKTHELYMFWLKSTNTTQQKDRMGA